MCWRDFHDQNVASQVERASAQIMQALGLAPGGRRSAAKPADARADAEPAPPKPLAGQALLSQQKVANLVQPPGPRASVLPKPPAVQASAQQKSISVGRSSVLRSSGPAKPPPVQLPVQQKAANAGQLSGPTTPTQPDTFSVGQHICFCAVLLHTNLQWEALLRSICSSLHVLGGLFKPFDCKIVALDSDK